MLVNVVLIVASITSSPFNWLTEFLHQKEMAVGTGLCFYPLKLSFHFLDALPFSDPFPGLWLFHMKIQAESEWIVFTNKKPRGSFVMPHSSQHGAQPSV